MFSPRSVASSLFFLLAFAFLLSNATADTQITFPSFSPESNGEFFTFGDVAHSPANRSYIINPGARTLASRGSCGALVYGKPVHIRSGAFGRVASFNISFSFKFASHGWSWDNINNPMDGSGLAISFVRNFPMARVRAVLSQVEAFKACKFFLNERMNRPNFAVFIDTEYNPSHDKEPSNNFIRVARRNHDDDVEPYTHNLCGTHTHCTYFSNGRIFTVWVDFASSSQTLEVRMANGSNAGNKPLHPLLLLPNYEFPKAMMGTDDVWVMFWGSADVHRLEEHELLSWSFFTTGLSESKLRRLLHNLKSRAAGIGATTGGVVVGTMAALAILWSIHSLATPSTASSRILGYSTGPHVFSYDELRKATENFGERNLLGRGASGVVYKGSLEGGGALVAIKQMNMLEAKQAESLFHAEVVSLGQIRHRNVVRLHGWCQEKGKLLLIYDYISNGTLNDWLFKYGNQQVLSLKMRLCILQGIGAALEYLHDDCSSCILHRDIKSSNILLDEDFKAYVGDFGLARLMDHQKSDKSTLVAGTFGYMAPELLYTGKATKKSDVYSFGILVLEVVCGKHPLDLQAIEVEDRVLLFKVWQAYEDGSLLRLVDPKIFETSTNFIRLFGETSHATQVPSLSSNFYDSNCSTTLTRSLDGNVGLEIEKAQVVSLLKLGLFCCLPSPKARPSMRDVNILLQQIQDIEDVSPIATISILSLPAKQPRGVCHSQDF